MPTLSWQLRKGQNYVHFTPLPMMERYVSHIETHHVVLGDFNPGIHCTPHAFFKKASDGTVPWVISRTCDHAGGQLKPSPNDPGKAICPLHNWEFDFATLSYSRMPNQTFETIRKTPLSFTVNGNDLTYDVEHYSLRVPAEAMDEDMPSPRVEVRHIAHASVALTLDTLRIVTDPWYVGECFASGWWLQHPPKADAWKLLKGADFLYISHNHPDHLHEGTLKDLARDIPIIVPKFDTGSVAIPLRAMGFTQVHELELLRLYRVGERGPVLAILPTSDHREDSALFVTQGDFSALLTVDCVGANKYVLPRDVTLLLTNFASGASGWPLCYDVVGPLAERAKIVTKNRGTALLEVMKYIAATTPKMYMPYAGFFEERAARDRMIRQYNIKNTVEAILEKVTARFPHVLGIHPLVHDVVDWHAGQAMPRTSEQPPLYRLDDAYVQAHLVAQREKLADFDLARVADYFCQSEFRDDLIVYLVLADDDFTPIGDSLRIDFSTQPITSTVMDGAALEAQFHRLSDLGKDHHMLLKARTDSLWQIVAHGRPLEELAIGFQCRIDRKPDQYNAAFWKHYTSLSVPMLRRGEDHLLSKLLEGANG